MHSNFNKFQTTFIRWREYYLYLPNQCSHISLCTCFSSISVRCHGVAHQMNTHGYQSDPSTHTCGGKHSLLSLGSTSASWYRRDTTTVLQTHARARRSRSTQGEENTNPTKKMDPSQRRGPSTTPLWASPREPWPGPVVFLPAASAGCSSTASTAATAVCPARAPRFILRSLLGLC
jgi:hypothetical protein